MKRIFLIAAAAILAVGALVPALPPAPAPAQDVAALLEQRQKDMKANGRAMKQLSGVFRGAAPYDRAKVIEAAGTLAANSGAKAAELFPDNALEVADSEALNRIAEEREQFTQIFIDLQTASEALAALAGEEGNDEALRAAFGPIGKTCSSCHTDFRVKN